MKLFRCLLCGGMMCIYLACCLVTRYLPGYQNCYNAAVYWGRKMVDHTDSKTGC